jgi:hypothetical protein
MFAFLCPFGIFYGHLVYFIAIWYILGSFGTFWGHLVHFGVIWYILGSFGIFFNILLCCTKKNLATQIAAIILSPNYLSCGPSALAFSFHSDLIKLCLKSRKCWPKPSGRPLDFVHAGRHLKDIILDGILSYRFRIKGQVQV